MPKLQSLGHKLRPSSRAIVRLPPKIRLPFYASPEWRSLIALIIKQRGRRCEDPDHWPGWARQGVRIFGDHIKELRDGGAPLDPRNVMLRCGACHTRKTMRERAKRR